MDVTGLIAGGVALAAATVFGLTRRKRDGTVARVAEHPVLTNLGVQPGVVTLLQFSSAFCAPCRATRLICADVARTRSGVTHLEIDAESHLDSVRALGVWRTPTLFIIDATGTVIGRVQGVPDKAALKEAVS